jgi:hypothetical protein
MRLAAFALLLTVSSAFCADDPGWVLVANHLHSSAGGDQHWSRGIKHIREYCTEKGIAFGILTDHDSIGGWFDAEFTKTGPGSVLVPGEEWTSAAGHANLVGFTASGPEDAIKPNVSGDYDGNAPTTVNGTPTAVDHVKMITEVHKRNGIVIINHPALRGYKWPDETFGADLCEVNGTWENPSGVNAKAWFARRIAAGQRIGAVGGSDYHYLRPKRKAEDEIHAKGLVFPDIDDPINLVKVDGPGLPGLYAALKARHVQVLKHRASPRCFVSVDANGDGKPDGIGGDVLTASSGARVRFAIRVTGGKGRELYVHDQSAGTTGHTIQRVPITSDDFTVTVDRNGSGSGKNATYCEVGKLETFTNPVWY